MSEYDGMFDGDTYSPERDGAPLASLLNRVRDYMLSHGEFRTISEIAKALGLSKDDHGTINSRLGDLRKDKHGGYAMTSQIRVGRLWEYRVWYSAPIITILLKDGAVQWAKNIPKGIEIPVKVLHARSTD